jgi:hypothetical protein
MAHRPVPLSVTWENRTETIWRAGAPSAARTALCVGDPARHGQFVDHDHGVREHAGPTVTQIGVGAIFDFGSRVLRVPSQYAVNLEMSFSTVPRHSFLGRTMRHAIDG